MDGCNSQLGIFDGSEGLLERYSPKTKCDYIRWEVVEIFNY